MKKRLTAMLSLCSLFLLASCGAMKAFEKDISIAVRLKGELYYSGVVNAFNNVLLPKMDASYVPEDMKFAGYTLDSAWTVEDGVESLYKEGALIRYVDFKDKAYNGGVEFFSQFVSKDTDLAPKHYLVVGWYNKPNTSGLDQAKINKLTPLLTDYLIKNGATEEDLNDFIIKGYEGDVGTIGAAINDDEIVDVFIGAGSNLKSTGGVDYVDRYAASKDYGSVSKRYVYLLREKPVARLVYEYFNSDEFYTIFE